LARSPSRRSRPVSSPSPPTGGDWPRLFAGPQGGFIGLDQVNVRLPRVLAGRGDLDLNLTVDGKSSNSLKINIR